MMMTKTMTDHLYTLKEFLTLDPGQQGYVLYMQEELPGSELKGWKHSYTGKDKEAFVRGGQLAVMQVQDTDD